MQRPQQALRHRLQVNSSARRLAAAPSRAAVAGSASRRIASSRASSSPGPPRARRRRSGSPSRPTSCRCSAARPPRPRRRRCARRLRVRGHHEAGGLARTGARAGRAARARPSCSTPCPVTPGCVDRRMASHQVEVGARQLAAQARERPQHPGAVLARPVHAHEQEARRLQSRSPPARCGCGRRRPRAPSRARSRSRGSPTRRPSGSSGSTPPPARRRAAGAPRATANAFGERASQPSVGVRPRLRDGHVLEGGDRHVGPAACTRSRSGRSRRAAPPAGAAAGTARELTQRERRRGPGRRAARSTAVRTGPLRAQVARGEGVDAHGAHERRRLRADGHRLRPGGRQPAHHTRGVPDQWPAGSGPRGMPPRCAITPLLRHGCSVAGRPRPSKPNMMNARNVTWMNANASKVSIPTA